MVVIIDYDVGNLFSVENAFRTIGASVVVSKHADDIRRADRLVLPGVGAFPDGMRNVERFGLVEPLQHAVREEKKFILGICLGMQLFASFGEEHAVVKGLGIVPGRARRFRVNERMFPIPHVGWNDVKPRRDTLFQGIEHPIFYFVHSYYFVPDDPTTVAADCEYGETFAAAVEHDNIFGVQFHPEKSQQNGLKVLENFLKVSASHHA